DSDMGPLVTKVHRDKVASYIDAGEGAGATIVVDGRTVQANGGKDGFWLGPTLIDHVTTDMSVYTDEIFGPVLSVIRVDSYDEALELVNSSPFGNGTAIFTNDGGAARRFQNEVEVGMVGINVPIPVPMAYYSFGGWKNSLFGDTHAHGTEGVYDEALELVNSSPFGNGTAIFTNDGGAARRFQNEVEVGMVGINVPIPVPMAYYSFGGWKNSLFGDTHAHGTEGVHFFTRGKVVTTRWLDPSHGGLNLGFPQNN
uniref:aldehyde dehydrogenase family protein n=1 Tax=Rhodococcus opacus TaxID=37919 RepID=UPI000A4DD6A9